MNLEGIKPVPHMTRDIYKLDIPNYITENGCPYKGEERVEADGMIHDDKRIDYLSRVLSAIDDLLAVGMDTRCYDLWTLMDKFKSCAGHSAKHGLLHTIFDPLNAPGKRALIGTAISFEGQGGNSLNPIFTGYA